MNFRRAQVTILAVFALVITFSVGYVVGVKGFIVDAQNLPHVTISRQTPPEKELNFDLFWRVWDTVKASYYDKSKINEGDMVYGAIKGMVSAVGDPYTVFLTPDENKVTQEDLSGNFEGVGIQIGYKGTQLAVISPLPGTPADRSGIKAGDLILGIKDARQNLDISTNNMSLPEAIQKIRGPKGSKVTLTVYTQEDSEPRDVEITRDSIDVPSVVLEYVGDNKDIAHIKLLKFGAETKQEWSQAVNDIKSKDIVTKMVLDLRNNPGGYLQAAIDIASDFVSLGQTVVIEEKGNGEKTEFKSETVPNLQNVEVVVLVNGGSASASEILAAALRDIKGIQVIGDTSFGKGTVQEPLTLENGSGLHITVGKWLTPKGTWVHEKGIEPDIKVENNQETTEDEQLDKAIETLQ